MAWPKGKPRKPKIVITEAIAIAVGETVGAAVAESIDRHASDCSTHNMPAYPNGPCDCELSAPQYPADWHPGQLLNVRNTGPDYTITLWPEEADHRKPERALHFTNPGEAQNFISTWYSRESHDPRAR